MTDQLCWTCRKACGRCSWSKDLTPVPGWTATAKVYKALGGGKDGTTYGITACPEYEKDSDMRCDTGANKYIMAAALYAAGRNDGEIARELGLAPVTIWTWRHRTGRRAIAKGGRPKGEAGG